MAPAENTGRTYAGVDAKTRRAVRRSQLLDAALDSFGTLGFAASSVKEILRRAESGDELIDLLRPQDANELLLLLREQQERDAALRQRLDAPPEEPVMDHALEEELRRLGYLDKRSR